MSRPLVGAATRGERSGKFSIPKAREVRQIHKRFMISRQGRGAEVVEATAGFLKVPHQWLGTCRRAELFARLTVLYGATRSSLGENDSHGYRQERSD